MVLNQIRTHSLEGRESIASLDKNETPVVAVVDPYSSGRLLVDDLKDRCVPMVAVRSTLDLADFWIQMLQPEKFVAVVDHNGNLQETMNKLHDLGVTQVVPGSEPGVLLADDLSDGMGLTSNGADTKECRRNKYAQQECIRAAGLRAVKQLYSDNLSEMRAWCEDHNDYPVVVKPSESGGSDGVYFCNNFEEVENAVNKELGLMNVNGAVNDKLLLQECLHGEEYIVDFVSSHGKHYLSAIWIYLKEQRRDIYWKHACYMMEAKGEVQDQLSKYCKDVLDALGMKHGASHTEIIMTKTGPCLVETGARLHGLRGPAVVGTATGIGTHEVLADTLVGGKMFDAIVDRPYFMKRQVIETSLMCDGAGVIENIDTEKIMSLPTAKELFMSFKAGDTISYTRDLASSPGTLIQVGANFEQIMADFETLRQWEREGSIYKIRKNNEHVTQGNYQK